MPLSSEGTSWGGASAGASVCSGGVSWGGSGCSGGGGSSASPLREELSI